jgi:hypothetical protein
MKQVPGFAPSWGTGARRAVESRRETCHWRDLLDKAARGLKRARTDLRIARTALKGSIRAGV